MKITISSSEGSANNVAYASAAAIEGHSSSENSRKTSCRNSFAVFTIGPHRWTLRRERHGMAEKPSVCSRASVDDLLLHQQIDFRIREPEQTAKNFAIVLAQIGRH